MQVRGPSALVPGAPNVITFYAGSLFRPGKDLVRSSGFEPPRYCYRQPLKLVRLPVPPRPHRGRGLIVAAPLKTGKTVLEHGSCAPTFQIAHAAHTNLPRPSSTAKVTASLPPSQQITA